MSDSICRKDSSRPVGRQLLVGAVPIPTRCAILGTNKNTKTNTNTISNTNPSTNTNTRNNGMDTFLSIVLVKYTVPYIVSAIEVKALFAHILPFQMTLSLSFIPRILPQSLFLATHPLAPGSFPILSDVCPFLHISLSPLQEDQMYLS